LEQLGPAWVGSVVVVAVGDCLELNLTPIKTPTRVNTNTPTPHKANSLFLSIVHFAQNDYAKIILGGFGSVLTNSLS
jgi:hypothetical protein